MRIYVRYVNANIMRMLQCEAMAGTLLHVSEPSVSFPVAILIFIGLIHFLSLLFNITDFGLTFSTIKSLIRDCIG